MPAKNERKNYSETVEDGSRHNQNVCCCRYCCKGKQHMNGEPAEDAVSERQSELQAELQGGEVWTWIGRMQCVDGRFSLKQVTLQGFSNDVFARCWLDVL
jgi:hypothetical protein